MGKGGSGTEKRKDAAMPKDAPPNGGASPEPAPMGPSGRVSEMQAKLHRWAVAEPGRRFDDLFNFVCDPAALIVAFSRVAGNQCSGTPGVDGLTVADIEESVGGDAVPPRVEAVDNLTDLPSLLEELRLI
jgi:hypothetical protein